MASEGSPKRAIISYVIGTASRQGIITNADGRRNGNHNRIILSRRKEGTSSRDPHIKFECNGVVIDTHNWRVISMPPKGMIQVNSAGNANSVGNTYNANSVTSAGNANTAPGIAIPNINNECGKPDLLARVLSKGKHYLHPIHDGTIVTLYFWSGRWCISSSNGYDVSNYKWMCGMTFAEIIMDLFSRKYPEAVQALGMSLITVNGTKLNFENLPRNMSHTIFFRHHKFHPVLTDEERVWHYGSVKTDEDYPLKLHFDSEYMIPHVPQRDAPITIGTNGIESSEDVTSKLELSLEQCLNTHFYGYILLSTDRRFNDIIFPSVLLTTVRHLMYTKIGNGNNEFIKPEMQMTYNAVVAHLRIIDRTRFGRVFPHQTEIVRRLEKLIQEVAIYAAKRAISDTNEVLEGAAPSVMITGNHVYADIVKYKPDLIKTAKTVGFRDMCATMTDIAMSLCYAAIYTHCLSR